MIFYIVLYILLRQCELKGKSCHGKFEIYMAVHTEMNEKNEGKVGKKSQEITFTFITGIINLRE